MSDYDDSYLSDSSEEDHYTVEAEEAAIGVDNKPSTTSESVVTPLMDVLPSSLASSVEISAEDRASINEAILKLEALNPTEDPVYSPLINGAWTLRYGGGMRGEDSEPKIPSPTREIALFLYSGGYSPVPSPIREIALILFAGGYLPGLFALGLAQKLPAQFVELADVEISISQSRPRLIKGKIDFKLFGGSVGSENAIEIKGRLEEESGLRFTEILESASVLGQTVDFPGALQNSRNLYVSYADDDILVVRDGAGVPEILVRK